MKPLPVEMACLLDIQNEVQAVWPAYIYYHNERFIKVSKSSKNCFRD